MALTIRHDGVTSDRSTHTARPAPGAVHAWEVSWLPGRHLSRREAIIATVLTDVTGREFASEKHWVWPYVEGWAAELGLTGPEALAQTSSPPCWTGEGRSALPADPEAGG
jgi:hypothetical protein